MKSELEFLKTDLWPAAYHAASRNMTDEERKYVFSLRDELHAMSETTADEKRLRELHEMLVMTYRRGKVRLP